MDEEIPRVEFVLLGESRVGNTSLLTRFANETFPEQTVPTTRMEFNKRIVEIDGSEVCVRVWDAPGQARHRHIGALYVQRASGLICAFSFDSPGSFERVESWVDNARRIRIEDVPIIIVGNKVDLNTGCIPREDIDDLVRRLDIKYIETSAKTGENVDRVFIELARDVLKRRKESIAPKEEPKIQEQSRKCY